jgi:diazepam-binding inhibitor (GABA receptor modulator, acyl-CoA-binding protein)
MQGVFLQMTSDIEARFAQAVAEARALRRAPDNMARLRLYGLYKQATQGDCHGVRPGIDAPEGRFKYDAWKALQGTPPEQAKAEYIAFVEDLKLAYLS